MRIFTRALHFGQRILQESKEFLPRCREFGFKVAGLTFLDGLFPPEKHSFYIGAIEEYVDRFMEPIVAKYRNWENLPLPCSDGAKVPVWCCWWQGTEQMPEIVRMCNDRLRQLIPEDQAELHMITADNYRDFVELPAYIIEKFEAGKMSITALSDILRVALLAKHGGFWIDSTVFISDHFPTEFITSDYYAQRMYDPVKWYREACKGRWCGFLMGGKAQNVLFLLLRDAFYDWWRIHESVIDYVILDYFLLAGYKNVPAIAVQIDNLPDNNPGVFDMYGKLHFPYSEQLFQQLTADTNLHKLTYKIDLITETEAGEPTLYAHLLGLVYGENEQ